MPSRLKEDVGVQLDDESGEFNAKAANISYLKRGEEKVSGCLR